MIVDIPTPDDFQTSGLAFINLAWSMSLNVLDTLNWLQDSDHESFSEEYNPERVELAAQDKLRTGMLLTQQGIELLLKGRIAAVSPFLLLRGKPSDWPKAKNGQDISFADLHTVDAQDLVRLHNSVMPAAQHLSAVTSDRLNELRRQRNAIAHTVDRRKVFQAKGVIQTILDVHAELLGSESWIDSRRRYLENDHIAEAGAQVYEFNTGARLIEECEALLRAITREELGRYFGIPEKARLLMCYSCHLEMDHYGEPGRPQFSVLREKGGEELITSCFVCHEERTAMAGRCVANGCDGTVFDRQEEICLACGNSYSFSPPPSA